MTLKFQADGDSGILMIFQDFFRLARLVLEGRSFATSSLVNLSIFEAALSSIDFIARLRCDKLSETCFLRSSLSAFKAAMFLPTSEISLALATTFIKK
jgi:hypothetical protein